MADYDDNKQAHQLNVIDGTIDENSLIVAQDVVGNPLGIAKPASIVGATTIDVIQDGTTHKKMTAAEKDAYDAHLLDTADPHSVTKDQVGLDQVDNTSDVDKPVSTAQATAIASGDTATMDAHKDLVTGVHGLGTASQIDRSTSTTDTTLGRAMKTGDWGFGQIAIDISSQDLDSLPVVTGFFRGNNLTNSPDGSSSWFFIQQIAHGATYITQSAWQFTDISGIATSYIRILDNGAWGSWQKVLDSNDVTATDTDTTAGKLLKVADFGLGDFAVKDVDPDSASLATGFYRATGANVPTGIGSWHLWHISRVEDNQSAQIAILDASGIPPVYTRARNASGVWSDWNRTLGNSDLTTSTTDTNTSHITKVGDWGLGYEGVTPTDIDDASGLYTGFHQCTDGVNGTFPPNSDKYGTLLVQRRYAGSQTQYFSKVSNNQVWTRHYHSSAWSDWQRVMQSEDVTQSNIDTTLDLLLKTGDWGIGGVEALQLPAGTELERPTVPVEGQLRYNEDIDAFEGYQAGAWASVGGGASGAPQNPVFYENDTNVTGDYTITSGKNAMSAGPITVDAGVSVEIPDGSVWTVV